MRPIKIKKEIENKVFCTEKAVIIAHDFFWDGKSFERDGLNHYLYRSAGNEYFMVRLTIYPNEKNDLIPLKQKTAIDIYNLLPKKQIPFRESFQGIGVEPSVDKGVILYEAINHLKNFYVFLNGEAQFDDIGNFLGKIIDELSFVLDRIETEEIQRLFEKEGPGSDPEEDSDQGPSDKDETKSHSQNN